MVLPPGLSFKTICFTDGQGWAQKPDVFSKEVAVILEDRMSDKWQKAGIFLFTLVVKCGTNQQYVSS